MSVLVSDELDNVRSKSQLGVSMWITLVLTAVLTFMGMAASHC